MCSPLCIVSPRFPVRADYGRHNSVNLRGAINGSDRACPQANHHNSDWEAISKTVSELVGKEYTAEVLSIDFNPIQNSSITDTVEMRLRISREWVESAIEKLEQEEAVELKHEQVKTRLSNARPSTEPH